MSKKNRGGEKGLDMDTLWPILKWPFGHWMDGRAKIKLSGRGVCREGMNE